MINLIVGVSKSGKTVKIKELIFKTIRNNEHFIYFNFFIEEIMAIDLPEDIINFNGNLYLLIQTIRDINVSFNDISRNGYKIYFLNGSIELYYLSEYINQELSNNLISDFSYPTLIIEKDNITAEEFFSKEIRELRYNEPNFNEELENIIKGKL